MQTRTFAPTLEHPTNEVDGLLEQVRQIQSVCDHDFRMIERLDLVESKVAGVFIGGVGLRSEFMSIRCLKCSDRAFVPVYLFCPECQGKMIDRGQVNRRKYLGFGSQIVGLGFLYKARLTQCENCGFRVVTDRLD